jgi:hypothetical protein
MKRTAVRLIVTVSLLGAAIGVAATPAAAIPSGCNWGSEGSFSWAQCSGGTGKYQAWAQCKPRHFWITNWYTAYGPVVSPSNLSIASCDGNHQVASYGITYA